MRCGSRRRSPTTTSRPTLEMPLVAVSRGQRVLDLVRWGLVPSWAKDLSIGEPADQRARRVGDDEARVQAGVREAAGDRPGRRLLRVAEARGLEAEAAVVHPPPGRRAARVRGTVGDLARPRDRRRRAAHPHVHDHHDRAPTICCSRSTSACRSCCPSRSGTAGSIPSSRTSTRCSSCSFPRPTTSSRCGRSRRS